MAAPKRMTVGEKPVLIFDLKNQGGKETKVFLRADAPFYVGNSKDLTWKNGWKVDGEKYEHTFPVEHQQLWACSDGPEVELQVWALGPGT